MSKGGNDLSSAWQPYSLLLRSLRKMLKAGQWTVTRGNKYLKKGADVCWSEQLLHQRHRRFSHPTWEVLGISLLAVLSDDSSPTPPARSQRHPGRFGAPTHVAVLAALCHHAAVQTRLTSNVEPGKHDARNKLKSAVQRRYCLFVWGVRKVTYFILIDNDVSKRKKKKIGLRRRLRSWLISTTPLRSTKSAAALPLTASL